VVEAAAVVAVAEDAEAAAADAEDKQIIRRENK
jgi:hypothetical protein